MKGISRMINNDTNKISGGKKIGIDIPKTWGTIVAFCILCIVFSKIHQRKVAGPFFHHLWLKYNTRFAAFLK
ncbi:hypothetical protein Avbf_12751 [Armadillidium vulgare]|nr:hypothetical protein Avbf_12751 [Armadillidium vulgare]